MIGSLVLLIAQAAQPVQAESPGQIISKMMSRYAYADSLSGKIVTTFSDGTGKVVIKTDVKYIRTNLLLITQDRKGKNGLNQSAQSDGAAFMYDPPTNTKFPVKPNFRLLEAVNGQLPGTKEAFAHDVGYLYNTAHMSLSPSTALDVAIAFKGHLQDLNIHIATVDPLQSATYKGKQVHKITGDWRLNRSTDLANGKFEMLISPEYDFLKLTHTAQFQANAGNRNAQNVITLVTTDEAEFKVNPELDVKLFNYRKKEKYSKVKGWHTAE